MERSHSAAPGTGAAGLCPLVPVPVQPQLAQALVWPGRLGQGSHTPLTTCSSLSRWACSLPLYTTASTEKMSFGWIWENRSRTPWERRETFVTGHPKGTPLHNHGPTALFLCPVTWQPTNTVKQSMTCTGGDHHFTGKVSMKKGHRPYRHRRSEPEFLKGESAGRAHCCAGPPPPTRTVGAPDTSRRVASGTSAAT